MEKRDPHVRPQFTQPAGHHPQVVVMQPDSRARRGVGRDHFGKAPIDPLERLPVIVAKARALPERVQHRPEGFLGEALVVSIDLGAGQRHAHGGQVRKAFRIDRETRRQAFALALIDAPRHPRAGTAAAEEAEQARNDAVRRARRAQADLLALLHFLIGQAVVNHDQLRLAPTRRLGGRAMRIVMRQQAEMLDGLEDAATARVACMQHAVTPGGRLEQRRLGAADAHAAKSRLVHRQVVERVPGNQHARARQLQQAHQFAERAALVGARRQDVEVTRGRIQRVAAQITRRLLDLLALSSKVFGVVIVGAAPLLRNFLAAQAWKGVHRLGHRALAGPSRRDARLQGLDRLQALAVQHRRAHVADQEIRPRQRRIGQQRHHGLQCPAGDPDQPDLRMLVDEAIEALTLPRLTGEEGAIQIGSQHQAARHRGSGSRSGAGRMSVRGQCSGSSLYDTGAPASICVK